MSRHSIHFTSGLTVLLLAFAMLSSGAVANDGRHPIEANELVVAEVDTLRRQIATCWNLPAITQLKDFKVHVRVQLRPDGTVRAASVVNFGVIIVDDFRLSVAKSARRAILGRRCNPLAIPRERRRRGDRFTLTLNPKAIFRRY